MIVRLELRGVRWWLCRRAENVCAVPMGLLMWLDGTRVPGQGR